MNSFVQYIRVLLTMCLWSTIHDLNRLCNIDNKILLGGSSVDAFTTTPSNNLFHQPLKISKSTLSLHLSSKSDTDITTSYNNDAKITRRNFIPIATTTTILTTMGFVRRMGNPNSVAFAIDNDTVTTPTEIPKKLNLTKDEILQIVKNDVLQNQFLVTGNVTKSIYLSNATFTDEIDTYSIDKWIIGTQRLFVGSKSHVQFKKNTNVRYINPYTIQFDFDEILVFNIPLLQPKVPLTGKVILTIDETTGYIASYREYWDQDVTTVLKSAKF